MLFQAFFALEGFGAMLFTANKRSWTVHESSMRSQQTVIRTHFTTMLANVGCMKILVGILLVPWKMLLHASSIFPLGATMWTYVGGFACVEAVSSLFTDRILRGVIDFSWTNLKVIFFRDRRWKWIIPLKEAVKGFQTWIFAIFFFQEIVILSVGTYCTFAQHIQKFLESQDIWWSCRSFFACQKIKETFNLFHLEKKNIILHFKNDSRNNWFV